MIATEPLPLNHSWPLWMASRFDLGRIIESAAGTDAAPPLETIDAGAWSCDLSDQQLTWSAPVKRLFGFTPEDAAPNRERVLRRYDEASRAAIERLRAYAIQHRRGFLLDAALRPVDGYRRWVRLVAIPVCQGSSVVRLAGYKADVSHLYRG